MSFSIATPKPVSSPRL